MCVGQVQVLVGQIVFPIQNVVQQHATSTGSLVLAALANAARLLLSNGRCWRRPHILPSQSKYIQMLLLKERNIV